MKPILYLGCPVWAHAPWRGKFSTASARREEFLPQYASVFRKAEGNTAFYGLPSTATVARWAAEARDDFRFCFKFPRAISHEAQLVGAAELETRRFFERLAPLAERCGPCFLQLPESFGVSRLEGLRVFWRGCRESFPMRWKCGIAIFSTARRKKRRWTRCSVKRVSSA